MSEKKKLSRETRDRADVLWKNRLCGEAAVTVRELLDHVDATDAEIVRLRGQGAALWAALIESRDGLSNARCELALNHVEGAISVLVKALLTPAVLASNVGALEAAVIVAAERQADYHESQQKQKDQPRCGCAVCRAVDAMHKEKK